MKYQDYVTMLGFNTLLFKLNLAIDDKTETINFYETHGGWHE